MSILSFLFNLPSLILCMYNPSFFPNLTIAYVVRVESQVFPNLTHAYFVVCVLNPRFFSLTTLAYFVRVESHVFSVYMKRNHIRTIRFCCLVKDAPFISTTVILVCAHERRIITQK